MRDSERAQADVEEKAAGDGDKLDTSGNLLGNMWGHGRGCTARHYLRHSGSG
ncbi:hypothetical protein RAA17_11860 [Komagataeibacter rhaeticus]|nr:hypothetical protein [Komagataeibacter rhaeticus]